MADLQVCQGNVPNSTFYCSQGYWYHLNKSYQPRNGHGLRLYLRCGRYYRLQSCRGSLTVFVTGDGEVHVGQASGHTCSQDHHVQLERQLRQDILRDCREGPFILPHAILTRHRARYPAEVAMRVTPNRMRSAMRRASDRYHLQNQPATIPELGGMIANHAEIGQTLDGTDSVFMAAVGPPGHHSVIFMSRRNNDFLREVSVVFSDGTFASKPSRPRCAQVFQISTIWRDAVLPLAQVLMESRTQVAYEAVLRALRDSNPQFRPRIVVTDFEAAEMNAWKSVFNIPVQGCYWHFTRAVILKAKSLISADVVALNERSKSIIRSLCGLPLLPQDDIPEGLMSLVVESMVEGVFEHLEGLFDYFHDTWINSFRFNSLSVCLSPYRTNNCSESANRMLRLRTTVHHPSISTFMDAVRSMESDTFWDILSLDGGGNPKRGRRRSAINNDYYILNYTSDLFAGRISINRFLHKASTRMFRQFIQFFHHEEQPQPPAHQ